MSWHSARCCLDAQAEMGCICDLERVCCGMTSLALRKLRCHPPPLSKHRMHGISLAYLALCLVCIHSLTHSYIHTFAHSRTHICSLTHSLTGSLLAHSITHLFTHSLTCSPTHSHILSSVADFRLATLPLPWACMTKRECCLIILFSFVLFETDFTIVQP